jgi:hypothetical protein
MSQAVFESTLHVAGGAPHTPPLQGAPPEHELPEQHIWPVAPHLPGS